MSVLGVCTFALLCRRAAVCVSCHAVNPFYGNAGRRQRPHKRGVTFDALWESLLRLLCIQSSWKNQGGSVGAQLFFFFCRPWLLTGVVHVTPSHWPWRGGEFVGVVKAAECLPSLSLPLSRACCAPRARFWRRREDQLHFLHLNLDERSLKWDFELKEQQRDVGGKKEQLLRVEFKKRNHLWIRSEQHCSRWVLLFESCSHDRNTLKNIRAWFSWYKTVIQQLANK